MHTEGYVPLTQLTRLLNTGVYAAAFAALGMMVGTLGPSLYLLASAWGPSTTPTQLGWLFFGRVLGSVLGTVLGTRVVSLLSTQANKALTLATSVIALTLLLIPYWSAQGLAISLFVLRGAGVGLVDTVGTALVMYLWDGASNTTLRTMAVAFGVGAVVSPLLIANTYSSAAPDTPYWSMTILILPLAVVSLLVRSPAQLAAPMGEFTLGSRLPRHYLRFTAVSEWLFNPTAPRVSEMLAERNTRATALLCALHGLVVGAELSFGSWLPTFAMRAEIGSFARAVRLSATFWAMLTLGRLCVQPLVSHVRPYIGMFMYTGGSLASVLLLISAKPSSDAPLSAPSLWTGVVLLGLSMSGLSPTVLSLFQVFDVHVTRSTINALVLTSWAGEFVVPVLLGHIHGSFEAGLHSGLLLLFIVMFTLVIVLFRSYSVTVPSHGWGAISRRSYTARPDIQVGVNLGLLDPRDGLVTSGSGSASELSSTTSSESPDDPFAADTSTTVGADTSAAAIAASDRAWVESTPVAAARVSPEPGSPDLGSSVHEEQERVAPAAAALASVRRDLAKTRS